MCAGLSIRAWSIWENKEEITVKKVYRMKELDCANCARKMEDRIRKLPGVENVTINFLMQKMTLEAEDSRFDEILQEAQNICRRIEPDCRIIL